MNTSTIINAAESTQPTTKTTATQRSKAAKAPAKTVTKQTSAKTQAVVGTPKTKPIIKNTPVVEAAATASPAEKASKSKKPKMVRDSFTIPKSEYVALQDLKERSNKLSSPAKKTELLRAGIKALSGLSDDDFLKAIQAVPSIKTGRPSKNNAE